MKKLKNVFIKHPKEMINSLMDHNALNKDEKVLVSPILKCPTNMNPKWGKLLQQNVTTIDDDNNVLLNFDSPYIDNDVVSLPKKELSITIGQPLKVMTIDDYNEQGLAYQEYFDDSVTLNSNNQWSISKVKATKQFDVLSDLLDYMDFDDIFECEDGVFGRKDDKEFLIMNCCIRPVAYKYIYKNRNEKPVKCMVCKIYLKGWAEPKVVTILDDKYSDIVSIAKKAYHAIDVKERYLCIVKSYLSKIFSELEHQIDSAKVQEEIHYTGWFNSNDGAVFYAEKNRQNCHVEKALPSLIGKNMSEVCARGLDFLKVGNKLSDILLIFIYSHIGFTLRLFKEAVNVNPQFLLYVKGMSGSLKSSVCSEIVNVFVNDTSKKKMNFEATEAAVFFAIEQSTDDTILLDDLSFSKKDKQKKQENLFEVVIRAIGDSTSKAKSNMKQDDIIQRVVQCGAVVTAEDLPNESMSSSLRYLVVNVDRNSFSGEVLKIFQRDSSIMRNYFAGYIFFLENHYSEIIQYLRDNFDQVYSSIEKNIEFDRFKYVATCMLLQFKLLEKYITMSGAFTVLNYEATKDCILSCIQSNEKSSKSLSIEQMYVVALFKSLYSSGKCEIATSLDAYKENLSKYIGFKQNDYEIWLRDEDVFKLVMSYWHDVGNDFTATKQKTHSLLVEAGVALRDSEGILRKTKRPIKDNQRPRGLVISEEKLQKVYEEINNY